MHALKKNWINFFLFGKEASSMWHARPNAVGFLQWVHLSPSQHIDHKVFRREWKEMWALRPRPSSWEAPYNRRSRPRACVRTRRCPPSFCRALWMSGTPNPCQGCNLCDEMTTSTKEIATSRRKKRRGWGKHSTNTQMRRKQQNNKRRNV